MSPVARSITWPVYDVGSAVSLAIRGIGIAFGHHTPGVGFRYRAAQRIGVLVADRLRAAAPGHRAGRHLRVTQVQVGQVLVAPGFGGVHHLAALAIDPERGLAVGIGRLHPATLAVVAVGFLPGHLVQAVAGIEYERLAVPAGDVAPDVVAQREAGAGLEHHFLLEQPALVIGVGRGDGGVAGIADGHLSHQAVTVLCSPFFCCSSTITQSESLQG